MIQLFPTTSFAKRYKKLTKSRQEKAASTLKRFTETPYHPALNYEKLTTSKYDAYYSIRVTLDCRIVLRQLEEQQYEVIDIGGHDVYKRLNRKR